MTISNPSNCASNGVTGRDPDGAVAINGCYINIFFIFYNLPMGYNLFLFYHTYIISLSFKTLFKIYSNLNVVLLLLIASMGLLLPSPNPHIHKQEKCSLNSCPHGYVLQGLYILGCTIDDCCIIILFQL